MTILIDQHNGDLDHVSCHDCHDSGWRPTFPDGDFAPCSCTAGIHEADLLAFAAEIEARKAIPTAPGTPFIPEGAEPPF